MKIEKNAFAKGHRNKEAKTDDYNDKQAAAVVKPDVVDRCRGPNKDPPPDDGGPAAAGIAIVDKKPNNENAVKKPQRKTTTRKSGIKMASVVNPQNQQNPSMTMFPHPAAELHRQRPEVLSMASRIQQQQEHMPLATTASHNNSPFPAAGPLLVQQAFFQLNTFLNNMRRAYEHINLFHTAAAAAGNKDPTAYYSQIL